MTGERKQMLGIKGAQTLPAFRIDGANMAEAVQALCDLLGAAKLGKASENSVYVCGVKLRNMDKEFKDLEERVKQLESKAEAAGNG